MAKSEVSDEEVQAAREEVEELRLKLAESEADRVERERLANNAITLAQLEAEKARLQSQLVVATAEAKSAGADETESPLAAARREAAAAEEQRKAQEKALDDKAEADKKQTELAAQAAENKGE